jgi:hypothetical protein
MVINIVPVSPYTLSSYRLEILKAKCKSWTSVHLSKLLIVCRTCSAGECLLQTPGWYWHNSMPWLLSFSYGVSIPAITQPDLAPSDFWLFHTLKMACKGTHFATIEDIKLNSKRSHPSVLPSLAGSMEQVRVCTRVLLWRWLGKSCHMSYHCNTTIPRTFWLPLVHTILIKRRYFLYEIRKQLCIIGLKCTSVIIIGAHNGQSIPCTNCGYSQIWWFETIKAISKIESYYIGFKLLTAVTMKSTVFWVAVLCISELNFLPASGYLRSLFTALKMEAIYFSRTTGSLQTTQCYNQEGCTLQNYFTSYS